MLYLFSFNIIPSKIMLAFDSMEKKNMARYMHNENKKQRKRKTSISTKMNGMQLVHVLNVSCELWMYIFFSIYFVFPIIVKCTLKIVFSIEITRNDIVSRDRFNSINDKIFCFNEIFIFYIHWIFVRLIPIFLH